MNARILLAGLSLATLSLQASDWPEYRGPTHNGISTEPVTTQWPASGPKVLWKVPSQAGFSSFAVAGGRCFTQELRDVDGVVQEALVARDAVTGKESWVRALGTMKTGDGGDDGAKDNRGGDGPRSTPAVVGGQVFTVSAKLVVQAFDAATGASVWKRDLIKEHAGRNISWQNAQSPVIEDGRLFVGGGGAGESLLALDVKTGAPLWKVGDEKITHATAVPTTIHGVRQVVWFLQSGLVSTDPRTGAELWRFAFPYKVSTAASPVISGDIVYCSAGYGVGAAAARIAQSGGTWTATELYRFAGNKPLANHWSTPVLKDGQLYGMFQFKEYAAGPVKCVDIATGAVKWEKVGFGPGHVILTASGVLALSDDGQLVLLEAAPAGYAELARAKVLDGKCWTTPVLSDGKVFARSTKEAVCLDLGVQRAVR
jgi:outer membrane protein assembly factor BamB